MSGDEDLDRLREQTDTGDRIAQAGDAEDQQALQQSVLEELQRIDAGESQAALTVWDEPLAALFGALAREEHRNDLEGLYDELATMLDADRDEEITQTATLRLALRVGLRETAPETVDAVREAVRDHQTPDL